MVHADGEINRDMGRTWQASHWHTDVSCVEEPPMGSVLHMQTVPPFGGDTLFASMSAAYDALSDRMKTYLDGLTATHDGERVGAGAIAPKASTIPAKTIRGPCTQWCAPIR